MTAPTDHHSIWLTILNQLQEEMPPASFDTWVRDTNALSLADKILTVSVRNAYARDWLTNRLKDTVARMLSEIVGEQAEVVFVTTAGEETVDVANQDDFEANEPNAEDPEKMVHIFLEGYDSAYEQIVQPDRAVYLPGYFRRWLRLLGPDLGWMYVSFRQAAYSVGARKGSKASRFSGKRLAALAGITERTYWNRMSNSSTWKKLKGLVNISDYGSEWNSASPTPKRLSRRYSVAMTLPLTHVDANSLRVWLSSHLEERGGPEKVLRAAAQTPLEQLIPLEAETAGEAMTVRRLVLDLFGGVDLSDELLDSLASAIQNHIMPQNDLIVVRLYFLEHILPHLGAGPGWMLTILRDLCYADPKTGERRNRVAVDGGYAEIAGWMGMSRPKTIWEWFNEKFSASRAEPGRYKNPALRVYLCEVEKDEPALDFEEQPRVFDVLIEEIPYEFLEFGLPNPNGALFSIAMARFAEANGATFSIGMARLSYPDGALFSIAMTRFSESIDATFRVFKALKLLKPNPLNSLNTTTRENEGQGAPGVVVNLPSGWVLDRLLQGRVVSQKILKAIRGGNGQALVSWLLYALSPAGKGLDAPWNYALSRLAMDPQCGAGGKYDELAEVPPTALIGLAHQAYKGHLSPYDNDGSELVNLWLDVMGSGAGNQAVTLLRFLLGEDAPIKIEKSFKAEQWKKSANGGWEHVIETRSEEV